MGKEEVHPSDALLRARAVLAGSAAAVSTVVVFLAALVAVTFGGATREIRLPLWVVIVFVVALVGVVASGVIFMYFETKRVWGDISYWRSEAGNLSDMVSHLEDLAFYDAITGLPNANALDRELSRPHDNRCLILLDLRDFGSVNKQYGHWLVHSTRRPFLADCRLRGDTVAELGL